MNARCGRKEKDPQRAGMKSPTVVRMRNAPQRGGLLEMVRRSAVLQAGLLIVVGFAQRLPVTLIPEQTLVTAMRNNVIDNRRPHIPALGHTLDAERMGSEILFPCPLPGVPIAAG